MSWRLMISALLVPLLAACSAPIATQTPQLSIAASATFRPAATPSRTQPPPSPTPTLTRPTRTPTITLLPTYDVLTPIPPKLKGFVGVAYSLESEQAYGQYVIRVWAIPTQTVEFIGKAITVVSVNQPPLEIVSVFAVDPLSGKDVTGDGLPDIIATKAGCGVSCHFSTVIYSLGHTVVKVFQSPDSRYTGNLVDINQDGVYEYVGYDDETFQSYCANPVRLTPKVVYEYQPDSGYVVASPHYPEYYAEDIAQHTEMAVNAKPNDPDKGIWDGTWDGTIKCSILPLVLDYLYSGQNEQAWQSLEQ